MSLFDLFGDEITPQPKDRGKRAFTDKVAWWMKDGAMVMFEGQLGNFQMRKSSRYADVAVLLDVKRATSLITQRVDKVAQELKQSAGEKQETKASAASERIFYASVAYLQFNHDTNRFDELKDKGDYAGLLTLAREYYDGNGMDEQHTYASPLQNRGDDLLIEDKDFAVVYNGSVGGTYEVMLKYTEAEVRDHIRRYGTDHASDDVKEVAKDLAMEEFAGLEQRKVPAFEMSNGDILHVRYNKRTDTLDVGQVTNAGLAVQHNFVYDHNVSLETNLQEVYEKLGGMAEYQVEKQEMDCIGGLRR